MQNWSAKDRVAIARADVTGVLVAPGSGGALTDAYLERCHDLARPYVVAFTRRKYATLLLFMQTAGRQLHPEAADGAKKLLWEHTAEGGRIEGDSSWCFSNRIPVKDVEAIGMRLFTLAHYMDTGDLIKHLRQLGVRMWVEGGDKLRWDTPSGTITADLLVTISLHKANLLAVVKEHGGLP